MRKRPTKPEPTNDKIELSTFDLIIIENALEKAFIRAQNDPESFAGQNKERIQELVTLFAQEVKRRLT